VADIVVTQHAQPLSKDNQMLKIDTRSKFKMAAAAILKITFLAITWPFLHAFAPNLKHRLEMGSHSQIYRQNSHSAKIQDGGGRNFEIS